ncbi:MAG: porin [Saprospiraceae bacterium]
MKALKIITILFIFVFIIKQPSSFCQKQRDVDISNLPYYNFGKGVGLTSPDSLFQFNIRFRMQNRFSFIQNDGKEAAIDGQIRRLRLRFDGFVGSPAFLYVLQLSFAPGDVGEIESGENLNIIRDAVVYYRASPKWNFGFGQTKLPGNRQRVNSSGALQLSDRTISNSRFNIDRDFGFFINLINEYQDQFSWNIKSAITTGDGRNFTKSPDNGLAYTSKIELLPFGRFTKDGVFFEGDIIREKKPKLMLSAAYHFNHKAKRQAGVLGDDLSQPKDLKSLLIDAIFKYNGFSFMSSYMSRDVTEPVLKDATGTTYIYKGHGIDFQSSYFITKNWEIIGRVSKVTPSSEIKSAFPVHQQYTLGFTKYIWEHAFKIQLEANLDRLSYFDSSKKNNIYTRLQIEMGI